MTEQELQSVINAVLSSIKTNSRSIGQLTGVQTLSDSDCFEVAGGRKIAYSVLRDLIFAAANTKLENIQTDIANSVLQSVSFDVTGNTATLTIKQKGYDAISVSVPIATDSQSGIMTAADKVKLDSTYSKQEIDAEVDAIRDEMSDTIGGVATRISNLAVVVNDNSSAIEKKQDKLTAGDKATRIIDDNLETKQIYRGTVININGVPQGLEVGAYCFNTATKKLYVGAQHGNALVTDTVPMPDDFLFVDTASGTTYRCDGTTLHNIANIKTINGHSLLGGGNVQLTGADFLLEQGAGLTINEAVNSNTEELQNKLGKDSIVQTPGTATDKVMSQKGVHDYINQRLMDSAQSHSSFGSGFCYRLNARQIELLEASDVITLEICAQINGGLNGYNNTAAMTYFDINFGNNHARFRTTNDGAYAFTGDSKLNPLSGIGWQLAATQTGVEPRMPNDRVLMVIDRKQGIVRLYDKCSRKIIECQREEYKSDSWLQSDDWLAIMTGAKNGYVADLWALRIYDRDVTVLQYDNSFRVKDAHMTEAILPFQHPLVAKTIDVNDWVIERFDKATAGSKPYFFPGNYYYDPDDGLLTGTNDTTDWVTIGPGSFNAGNLYGIIDVDFEVTGGKWRVAKKTAIKVYAITKADGTDMGIEGIMGNDSDRTELEAGRYTMSYISFNANAFCDIAPGAKIKMHSMHQHTLHCVANINPRYYCNMQCWDDARQEWWTPLDVKNHETPVVPTFSDAAWRSVPAPALLSQPSFNGQLKIDDSGKVYVGVVVGATRTWKQINNT